MIGSNQLLSSSTRQFGREPVLHTTEFGNSHTENRGDHGRRKENDKNGLEQCCRVHTTHNESLCLCTAS